MTEDFTIIGAGLVGSLLAVTLRKRGYKVAVYERYHDIRSIPALGRSINLVLTSRGLRSVALLGESLCAEMLSFAVPVYGRIVHQTDGSRQYQAYGKNNSEHNWSISRFELNKFLLDKAAKVGAEIFFNHNIKDVDLDNMTITAEFDGQRKTVKTGVLIGTDGGGSAIRYAMKRVGSIDFKEEPLSHGYKEVIFPKAPYGGPCLDMRGLHIWPRGHHMLMGLANLDGSFTGTLYCPSQGEDSFKELTDDATVLKFFNAHYADAIKDIGGPVAVTEQIKNNSVGFLGTVRCTKFNHKGRALLLGDAGHAIVPFFGQGCNSGFEDVRILMEHFDYHVNDVKSASQMEKCFDAFDANHRINTVAIADMALDNFVEMCSRVGDPKFLLKKSVENEIENKFPHKYRSRYAMVCYGGFGNVTYNAAFVLGKVQDELLEVACKDANEVIDVDMKKLEGEIDRRLVPLQKKLNVDLLTVSRQLVLPKAKL